MTMFPLRNAEKVAQEILSRPWLATDIYYDDKLRLSVAFFKRARGYDIVGMFIPSKPKWRIYTNGSTISGFHEDFEEHVDGLRENALECAMNLRYAHTDRTVSKDDMAPSLLIELG